MKPILTGVNYFAGWWKPLPNKWHRHDSSQAFDHGEDWRPDFPNRIPLLGEFNCQETMDLEMEAAMQRLEERLDVAAPPALGSTAAEVGCPPSGVRELERTGRVVLVDADLAWSAAAWARLRDEAVELADRGPLTPAALRDATGTSRKYVMALLEDLDRRGILRRTSAGHVRGPRA